MTTAIKQLQCTEVWGGNQAADTAVSLFGIDAWVYAKPHLGDAGGDIYYLASCAAGQLARMVVADVSGHGDAVSGVARQLRRLMRRYLVYHSQTQLVRAMNRHFSRITTNGGFATAVVLTIDAPVNRMLLTNAGHPPPLRFDVQAGEWQLLDQHRDEAHELANVPLGIERAVRYDQTEFQLNVGDLILCYTDSLIEALNASGQAHGTRGLLETVEELDVSHPADLVPSLLSRIAALHPDNLSDDDLTVLLFRPNGLRPFVPMRDMVQAPFRAVRSLAQSYMGAGG